MEPQEAWDRSPPCYQSQLPWESELVLAPWITFCPVRSVVEARIAPQTRYGEALRDRGHHVHDPDDWSAGVSRVCAITVDHDTGTRLGGADPRSTSYAIGW